MLVLTRQANQSIMIGDDIIISVLEIHGDQVRLGIEAPRRIPVHREEVHRKAQAATCRAAAAVDVDVDGAAAAEAMRKRAPSPPPAADR